MGTDDQSPERTVLLFLLRICNQATADMSGKYMLALFLALQVSMSLCQVPEPSADLVEKYEAMKTTFYARLLNAYNKLQAAAKPYVDSIETRLRARLPRTTSKDCSPSPTFRPPSKSPQDWPRRQLPWWTRLALQPWEPTEPTCAPTSAPTWTKPSTTSRCTWTSICPQCKAPHSDGCRLTWTGHKHEELFSKTSQKPFLHFIIRIDC